MKSYSDSEIYEAIKKIHHGVHLPDDMIDLCMRSGEKAIAVALARGVRWKEAESYIIDHVLNSRDWDLTRKFIFYCTNLIKGRWYEFEDAVESNPKLIESRFSIVNQYSINVLKHRWHKIETHIKSPNLIRDYALYVIGDRWLEKEVEILKNLDIGIHYCGSLIGSRWKELEDSILSIKETNKRDSLIIKYASLFSSFGSWPEAESVLEDPYSILQYTIRIRHCNRWPEKEHTLAKDPRCALIYAQEVIKGPFKEAENAILNSSWYFEYFSFATSSSRKLASQLSSQFPLDITVGEVLKIINDGRNADFEKKLLDSTHNQTKAVWYATNVLRGRWPEMEEKIRKSAKCAVLYARDVIKGRWEQAEKYISKNTKYLSQYAIEVIKGKLPDVLHNKMITAAMINSKDKHAKSYFEMLENSNAN